MTPAYEDSLGYDGAALPALPAEEEKAAMLAGVQAGLADVEAGRTILLEDYKAQVEARRSVRHARKPR